VYVYDGDNLIEAGSAKSQSDRDSAAFRPARALQTIDDRQLDGLICFFELFT